MGRAFPILWMRTTSDSFVPSATGAIGRAESAPPLFPAILGTCFTEGSLPLILMRIQNSSSFRAALTAREAATVTDPVCRE